MTRGGTRTSLATNRTPSSRSIARRDLPVGRRFLIRSVLQPGTGPPSRFGTLGVGPATAGARVEGREHPPSIRAPRSGVEHGGRSVPFAGLRASTGFLPPALSRPVRHAVFNAGAGGGRAANRREPEEVQTLEVGELATTFPVEDGELSNGHLASKPGLTPATRFSSSSQLRREVVAQKISSGQR